MDLTRDRPIGKEEKQRRQKALNEFADWVWGTFAASLEKVFSLGAPAVNEVLVQYAQAKYQAGKPLGSLRQAVLAVVDEQRDWRWRMGKAWDAVRVWQDLVPTFHHRPMPQQLLLAMACLALCWEWDDVALILLVGFAAMLRRGEAMALRVRNFIFGDWHLALEALRGVFFVQIESPKMRRKGARLEHVRLCEAGLAKFAKVLLQGRETNDLILGVAASVATKLFLTLATFFGVSTVDGCGVSWASLRGGGATHRYLIGQLLDDIRWDGRWGVFKTLDHYIQEVAAVTLLTELPRGSQERIRLFAGMAPDMLSAAIHRLQRRQASP